MSTENKNADPRNREYDAVGESGRRGALISVGLAGVAVLGVIIGLIILSSGSDPEPDENAISVHPANEERPREFVAESPFQGTAGSEKIVPGADRGEGAITTTDCPVCPAMVTIEPGRFAMGITEEEAISEKVPRLHIQAELPVHGVTIKRPFAVSQTEVTVRQFSYFVDATGHQSRGCTILQDGNWVHDPSKSWLDPGFNQKADHPVVCVSQQDAMAYVAWISGTSDKRYRLLSETEWEYAARAGSTTPRFWGKTLAESCANANVSGATHHEAYPDKTEAQIFPCDSGFAQTAPVAEFFPNRFHLYDVLGNAREVTSDCWNPSHWGKGLDRESRVDGACDAVVIKGGGWFDAPVNVRASRRFRGGRDDRRSDQGFRVAKDVPLVVIEE